MGNKEQVSPFSSKSNPHREVYFELKEGVFLVPGASRAAVCDTITGNVYSINNTAQQVALGLHQNNDFWQKLQTT